MPMKAKGGTDISVSQQTCWWLADKTM